VKTLGIDASLNHGALVELDDGILTRFWYWTQLAGSAARHENGVRLEIPKSLDKQASTHWRLSWIKKYVIKIVRESRPDFAGLEDYAVGAAQGAHYLGEAGGVARLALRENGIKYRTHDPIAVKLYAAHDGSADKFLMEESVRRRWGVDFSDYNQPPTKKGEQGRGTSEDLADAFAIARLVYVEARIRSGNLAMTDLEHDKERQVFLRTTKANPVNLLGREWLYNPAWRKELQLETRKAIDFMKGAK
jgi:Holliday junction resolvasome RuvABC endonuclease subunit